MKLNIGPPAGQKGKPQPLIGQKGVQYGLQQASAKPEKKGLSLFTIDDNDDMNVMKRMEMEETQKRNAQKAKEAMEQALKEDPMAFEYDAVYKEMKKEEIARKEADKVVGKPQAKYMDQLLRNAEVKQREDMVVLQKKLQRELEAEKAIFGDANETKFVTTAYKREIEKNKIYEEEQRQKEERDKKHTIEGRGNSNAFLLNLLDSRSSGRAIKTEDDMKRELKEAQDKKELAERGTKRARSPSPDRSDSEDKMDQERERERDRINRLRERAEKDAVEAEKLREKREKEREARTKELQTQFAKHSTSEEAAQTAKERYLARKRARTEGQQ